MSAVKNKDHARLPINAATRSRRGFTLIELMVVLLIIGLLAGLIGLKVLDRIDEAKITKAGGDIHQLNEAVKFYYRDIGRLPEDLLDLVEAPPEAENWKGYLDGNKLPKDPWGNEYKFMIIDEDKKDYDIYSLGPDGEESDDDITLQKLDEEQESDEL
jgi:general secretion pathway protein G